VRAKKTLLQPASLPTKENSLLPAIGLKYSCQVLLDVSGSVMREITFCPRAARSGLAYFRFDMEHLDFSRLRRVLEHPSGEGVYQYSFDLFLPLDIEAARLVLTDWFIDVHIDETICGPILFGGDAGHIIFLLSPRGGLIFCVTDPLLTAELSEEEISVTTLTCFTLLLQELLWP
jgi:hypothetical protein